MWKRIIDGFNEVFSFFIDEVKLVVTDAGTVLFFMLAMFIYALLYTMGYEKETVKDLPVAVVDLDHSSLSRQFSRMADATEQLQVTCKPGSLKEAEQLFYDGLVNGVILIPEDFEKDVLGGRRTSATVYCDVSYFMLYKQVYAGAVYATGTFGAGVEIKRLLAEGKSMAQAMDMQDPLKVNVYNLYNSSGGYASFIMPGMIVIIMQQLLLIGIGMLGGTIREKKIFLKMNSSVIRRMGSIRLVFAKASAYVLFFLFTSLFSMFILHRWFVFPDNGKFFPIMALMIPYLYSVSFLGLGISMLFKERVQSIMFMVFISPVVVFLSGVSWPAAAIPPVLYTVAHIFPSTFMVPAYLKLRMYGGGFEAIHAEWAAILIQMVVYFIFACYSYKLSIKRFGKKIGTNIIKEELTFHHTKE
jgi:ABC-type multidrug transport system, permease component